MSGQLAAAQQKTRLVSLGWASSRVIEELERLVTDEGVAESFESLVNSNTPLLHIRNRRLRGFVSVERQCRQHDPGVPLELHEGVVRVAGGCLSRHMLGWRLAGVDVKDGDQLSVRLSDGTWLAVTLELPDGQTPRLRRERRVMAWNPSMILRRPAKAVLGQRRPVGRTR